MNDNRVFLKEFARYVSLNIISMLGLSCYILADTFFISKGLGAEGLAALNLAIPVFSFISGSGLMLGMGGATKYSIQRAQDKPKKANETFTSTGRAAVLFALIFFAAGLCAAGKIARLLGAEGKVFGMTRIYLMILLIFAPAFILNNILLCFVRNDGNPRLTMCAMLSGSFLNIVLDYIFIFPLGLGMPGAALATGIAPVVSMLILSVHLLKRQNHFHLIRCKASLRLLRDIISGGFPSLVTEVSSGLVIIVFNLIILGLQGNIGVAAYGIIANLSLVVISIYTGVAQGIQPLLSRYHGKSDAKGVRVIFKYALGAVLALSAVTYILLFLGAPGIVDIFNSEHNVALKEIAVSGLRIYFTGCVFAGFNIVLSVYFTSAQYPVPAHIISLLRGFLVIIPLAFLFSNLLQMTGVWCVFPVTELMVAGIGLGFYRRKSDFPLEKNKDM